MSHPTVPTVEGTAERVAAERVAAERVAAERVAAERVAEGSKAVATEAVATEAVWVEGRADLTAAKVVLPVAGGHRTTFALQISTVLAQTASPSRTCSNSLTSAASHTYRSLIIPVNMGSMLQWLLPTYSPLRSTSPGNRKVLLDARKTPSQ